MTTKYTKAKEYKIEENVSRTVPKYPFIEMTTQKGETVYLRCHPEYYQEEERRRMVQNKTLVGVMGESFGEIWKEANSIVSVGCSFLTNLNTIYLNKRSSSIQII